MKCAHEQLFFILLGLCHSGAVHIFFLYHFVCVEKMIQNHSGHCLYAVLMSAGLQHRQMGYIDMYILLFFILFIFFCEWIILMIYME